MALLGQACGEPAPPPDVVLLVVDTLRADHLGLYGYPRETSPALDRFGESAIVFDNVFSPASWTLPAVASLLTGAYPSSHGLRARTGERHVVSLGPSFETLAQVLGQNGYRTEAIVANPWIGNPKLALDRGFERFVEQPQDTGAAALNELARAAIERPDPRPLFLYVHYMDIHGPYVPPGSTDARLSPVPGQRDVWLSQRDQKKLPGYLKLHGAKKLGAYVDAYDIGIRRWDDAFGRFVDWLQAAGRLERSVIAVVSDHGEELLEHGGWNHGETLFQEQLHVPWVIRVPGLPPRRIASPVSLIDVTPTLLGQLALLSPKTAAGLDALGTSVSNARTLYSETEVRIGGVHDTRFAQLAMRRGSTKWLMQRDKRSCYDLEADPAEKKPLRAGRRCAEAEFEALARWGDETRRAATAMSPGEVRELSEAEQQELRELGYLE